MRNLDRISYRVPIFELPDFRTEGTLRDITEKGFGVRGIDVGIGEIKEFVIPADDFVEIDPLVFEAECKWIEEEHGDIVGGFEITDISEHTLSELRKLIRFVSL
jgi:hypothetical protein